MDLSSFFSNSKHSDQPQADPNDFSNKYNTKLSPEEEKKFQAWALANNRTKDSYDYDMRGAWKEMQSGKNLQSDNGHFPDTYKKPNHPTFSDQSVYNGIEGNVGGKWEETKDGKVMFTPSKTNLKNMTAEELKNYFDKVEPGIILNIPKDIAKKMYPSMKK